ncbi:unnamed protein product, partial [Discosporangium mesarthrocarpum]
PVLKHGPRSLTCPRVRGCQTPVRNESERRWEAHAAPSTDPVPPGTRFECERARWDPKDGELCLSRAKY